MKIIVPFPGGGINDVLARILADKLAIKWSQPVVIENKTGAGGNIGAELAYQWSDFEVRQCSRHVQVRTSELRTTSNFMILVRF